MENYPNNSNKAKEAPKTDVQPKTQKVVNGVVKTKKKSGMEKFADTFIAEDIKNVKTYVVQDVVIPAVKDILYDAFTDGLAMMLGRNGRSARSHSSSSSRYSYDKAYSRANSSVRAGENRVSTGVGRFNFDSILFNDRGDAERVLMELDELISQYGLASVQDLYSSAGLSCPYTYEKYGWTDLRAANVVRARDDNGYYIKLPKAMPL